MLKKIGKWVLYVVGSLLCILLFFYLIVYIKTQSRIEKTYEVKVQTLSIPNDSLSCARGKTIAVNRGCMGCHGADLGGGRVFLAEKNPIGVLSAPNITSGKGGITFSDADWIKVLRHGVNKNNKSVWLMPSQDIYEISNQDMKDLIHYVKSFNPVDRIVPAKSIKPLGRVLLFLDKLPFLSAEMINHNAVVPDVVQSTVSPEYGHYLATTCQGCHGSRLTGALRSPYGLAYGCSSKNQPLAGTMAIARFPAHPSPQPPYKRDCQPSPAKIGASCGNRRVHGRPQAFPPGIPKQKTQNIKQ